MRVEIELAKMAKQKKICESWYNELRTTGNKEKLIAMYLKGIDFCLANDYPNNEFIRKHFKGVMENYGVFLDDVVNLNNIKKGVFLGVTAANIEIKNYTVSELFVKHESKISLHSSDNSFVMIDIFDNATLDVRVYDHAKVCVNKYGNSVVNHHVFGDGVVKIIEKHKTTY